MLAIAYSSSSFAAQISFTMDDPEVQNLPLLSSQQRDEKILAAFDKYQIKGALFVCGKRIDNPDGRQLLKKWDAKNHILANHTFSHLNFNETEFTVFSKDALKVESQIESLKNFRKIFRFPFLKEGDTQTKRDQMRSLLKQRGYRNGYVTIDASDWAIDNRLIERLRKNPRADLKPYRDFYLKHIWERAQFYDGLAKKVYGRQIKHTLLIHHSLLNALFLEDLMSMFKEKGWTLISAEDALKDPLFEDEPDIVPAGESIVWAMAKESGKFESILRYPGENDIYENPKMDAAGL